MQDVEETRFAIRSLSVLAYASGFTLWHYRTRTVRIPADGFFDEANDMLAVGDLILVSGSGGATILVVKQTHPTRVGPMELAP